MKKLLWIAILATGIMAAEVSTASCVGCHGADWSKSALGKSKIVSEMTQEEIKTALNGYKDGTYGGPMAGVMKGQVMRLTDADIAAIASQIKPQ